MKKLVKVGLVAGCLCTAALTNINIAGAMKKTEKKAASASIQTWARIRDIVADHTNPNRDRELNKARAAGHTILVLDGEQDNFVEFLNLPGLDAANGGMYTGRRFTHDEAIGQRVLLDEHNQPILLSNIM